MYDLALDAANAIPFVLVSAAGIEVAGLGSTFSVTLSANGGTFGAGAGAKAELGNGWYLYTATAGECATAGILALRITAAGCAQQNLVCSVSFSAAMLTAIKAKTDLLDTSAVTVVSGIEGDELTFYVGATFDTTITGLTIPADWVKALATLKREDADTDSAALLQVQVSNPGIAEDGLIRRNGATPGTGENAWAGLTIDQAAGTVQVLVHMSATAVLLTRVCRWDLKVITSDSPAEGWPLVVSSPAKIVYTTTRATS